jgi:hypothetical protein
MKTLFYALMPGNKNMVDNIIKKLEDIFNKEDKPIEDIIDDNPELKDKISNIDLTGFKISEPSISDKEFYEKVLKGIGAPVTPQNMLFFYSWRQAEGAKATFNPFNTTKKMEKQSFWNCLKKKDGKCVGGVKNYSSKEDGITATIETLNNGRYECIVDGLKNDIGAKKIAQCSSLKTWGTGELVSKVLNGSSIKPPEISRTLVKKV